MTGASEVVRCGAFIALLLLGMSRTSKQLKRGRSMTQVRRGNLEYLSNGISSYGAGRRRYD
jgi:hypothetical protein